MLQLLRAGMGQKRESFIERLASAFRELKIVVEIDGGTHSMPREMAQDRFRAAYLERQGYRIFRVHNTEVCEDIDGVLDTLIAFVRGEGL